MAEVRVLVNGNEYMEKQFQKDLIRMFDTYRKYNRDYMGDSSCTGVECIDCPLRVRDESSDELCIAKKGRTFEAIGFVYEWALKHPVTTNADKLKEIFGDDVFNYIHLRVFHEDWFEEEYKEPKGENKNDD